MDPALKQRLVGASVIIALAVIFIPMIFDDSNQAQNQSISIKIPNEPADLKHRTLNIDSQIQSNNESSKTETAEDMQLIEKAAPIKKQETIIDVVDNSKSNDSKATEKTLAKEVQQDTKTGIKQQESKQQEIKKQKAPVSEIKTTTGKAKAAVIDSTQASYRVKLGSFSSQKNAQQLKAKIVNKGLQAFVEKDNVTGLYKVFSNQVATKAAADKMNAKIQKLKLNIGKTSIEKLSAEAQSEAELQLDSGWILQIGIFSSKENSLKLRDKIRKKGFVSFVDETFNVKKQRRYRVRIGPYATREEAMAEKTKINKSMHLKSLIKPHEKQRVVN